MNVGVIRDVIAVVLQRRRIHRLQPQTVHAERRGVIEARGQPGKVADAVRVAIGERFDVKLIEDGVLVPERVG
jgi:hypothetical protein